MALTKERQGYQVYLTPSDIDRAEASGFVRLDALNKAGGRWDRGLKYPGGSSLVALSAKVCVGPACRSVSVVVRGNGRFVAFAVGIVSYRVVGIVFHVWRYAGLTTERRGRARAGCRASVTS